MSSQGALGRSPQSATTTAHEETRSPIPAVLELLEQVPQVLGPLALQG